MNSEYIKELLDKYFEAETSLEEERKLKEYFNGTNIDQRFSGVSSLFKVLKAESNISNSKVFNVKTIKPSSEKQSANGPKVFFLARYAKIAAAAVVLAIASVLVVKFTLNTQAKDIKEKDVVVANYIEITDPDDARAYTEDALKILAQVFKTSEAKVGDGMKVIDETPVIGSRQ